MKMNTDHQETFTIHYYFNDQSHSMDAFTRNSMERNILEIIKQISKQLNVEIKIETEAREEGGLKEIFLFVIEHPVKSIGICGLIIKILTGCIRDISETRGSLYETETKKLIYQQKKREIDDISDNPKIKQERSEFYKQAEKCKKIDEVGFKRGNANEDIVKRKDFNKFIVEKTDQDEIDNNAKIIINTPVLTDKKTQWNGSYKGKDISFAMKDNDFKNGILNRRFSFENGTFITAVLNMKKTFDDDGNEIKIQYSVSEVINIEQNGEITNFTNLNKRKNKGYNAKQMDLDFEKIDTQNRKSN